MTRKKQTIAYQRTEKGECLLPIIKLIEKINAKQPMTNSYNARLCERIERMNRRFVKRFGQSSYDLIIRAFGK